MESSSYDRKMSKKTQVLVLKNFLVLDFANILFLSSLFKERCFMPSWSQSYQTFISSFFLFLLLSFAISKHWQYFLMLQTLKFNKDKWKKSLFYEEKKFGRIDSWFPLLYNLVFETCTNIQKNVRVNLKKGIG